MEYVLVKRFGDRSHGLVGTEVAATVASSRKVAKKRFSSDIAIVEDDFGCYPVIMTRKQVEKYNNAESPSSWIR